MAEETENNKITLNLDFEPIIPWNGQQDTGRDVRLKLDRNWQKVVDAFNALISFMVTADYLDDKFLRKDKDDTANGKITFNKGWETKEFISGLLGHGAKVDEYGQAELESLFIRTFLEVPELRFNRYTVRMGDEINSVSAGVVESVTPDKDADGNVLTTGTLILKLEDTDIGTLEYDDIVTQIYSDLLNKDNNSDETSDDGKGNRHMKGFATVMFKVLEVSGERNEIIRYSLRPLSDNWKKQVHPYQFGAFSQRGNFSNKDRQIIVYKGLYPKPYTRYMDGVNDWEFTAKMIGMQLGYLGNLSVFGMDMTGYSAYLNNVYFTGMIRQMYIPTWIEGESSAHNGTIVNMDGDMYISKGDTDLPPCFDLTDEDGNSLLLDEEGEEKHLAGENSEYDRISNRGQQGEKGEDGLFVYDCGLFNPQRAYYYKVVDGKLRRDKMIFQIGGYYYNFLVKNRQSNDSEGLIGVPPEKLDGTDPNWEVMSQFQSLIADTLFGTNANIGGFMTSAEKMVSQSQTSEGEPLFEINGQNGTMTMRQSGGTSWQVDKNGIQSVGNAYGERIEVNPNARSISSYDKDGIERTVIDGSEYAESDLIGVEGGVVTLNGSANPSAGYSVTGYGMKPSYETVPISSVFYSSVGVLDVDISSMNISVYYPVPRMATSDEIQFIPYGSVRIYVETYDTVNLVTMLSRKVVGVVSVFADSSSSATSSDFRKVPSVPLAKGYHRLVAVVEAQGGSENYGTTATGTWSVLSAHVSVESYVSRHFANGMFLSSSSTEYFLAMSENGKMKVSMASGGNVYSILDGHLSINGISQPIMVYAARITDTSESSSDSPTKKELLNNGSSATLTKTSTKGEYTLSLPSSYGLTGDNMLVNLLGYGIAAGEDSDIKATLRSYRIASTAMVLTIRTSDDASGNYGGFYIEIKKIV